MFAEPLFCVEVHLTARADGLSLLAMGLHVVPGEGFLRVELHAATLHAVHFYPSSLLFLDIALTIMEGARPSYRQQYPISWKGYRYRSTKRPETALVRAEGAGDGKEPR